MWKPVTESPLMLAVRTKDPAALRAAIETGGNVNEADVHGHPGLPLRTACFGGPPEIVEQLIRAGADVNASAADGPNAPLRLATRAGQRAIADLLIAHGAHLPEETAIDPALLEPLAVEAPAIEETPAIEEVPAIEPSPSLLPATPPPRPLDDPAREAAPQNILQWKAPFPVDQVEEVDVLPSWGVDTDILNADLRRMVENAARDDAPPAAPAPAEKKGFWQRRS